MTGNHEYQLMAIWSHWWWRRGPLPEVGKFSNATLNVEVASFRPIARKSPVKDLTENTLNWIQFARWDWRICRKKTEPRFWPCVKVNSRSHLISFETFLFELLDFVVNRQNNSILFKSTPNNGLSTLKIQDIRQPTVSKVNHYFSVLRVLS